VRWRGSVFVLGFRRFAGLSWGLGGPRGLRWALAGAWGAPRSSEGGTYSVIMLQATPGWPLRLQSAAPAGRGQVKWLWLWWLVCWP
jgi:hypothetical protein